VQPHRRQLPVHGEGVQEAHAPPPVAASCKSQGPQSLCARSRTATPPRLYATATRVTPRSPRTARGPDVPIGSCSIKPSPAGPCGSRKDLRKRGGAGRRAPRAPLAAAPASLVPATGCSLHAPGSVRRAVRACRVGEECEEGAVAGKVHLGGPGAGMEAP